jgi:hypothetical protein
MDAIQKIPHSLGVKPGTLVLVIATLATGAEAACDHSTALSAPDAGLTPEGGSHEQPTSITCLRCGSAPARCLTIEELTER